MSPFVCSCLAVLVGLGATGALIGCGGGDDDRHGDGDDSGGAGPGSTTWGGTTGSGGGPGAGGAGGSGASASPWTFYAQAVTDTEDAYATMPMAGAPEGSPTAGYWFSGNCGTLTRFDAAGWTHLSFAESLGNNVCQDQLAADSQGKLWLGTNFMLATYDGSAFAKVVAPGTDEDDTTIWSMLMTDTGTLVIGWSSSYAWGGGISVLRDGVWTTDSELTTDWPSGLGQPRHLALVGDTIWFSGWPGDLLGALKDGTVTQPLQGQLPLPGHYLAGLGTLPTGELVASVQSGEGGDGVLWFHDGTSFTVVDLPPGSGGTATVNPSSFRIDRAGRVWINVNGRPHVYDDGQWDPPDLVAILEGGPHFNLGGATTAGGFHFDPQDRLWIQGYRVIEGTTDYESGTSGIWVSPSIPMD